MYLDFPLKKEINHLCSFKKIGNVPWILLDNDVFQTTLKNEGQIRYELNTFPIPKCSIGLEYVPTFTRKPNVYVNIPVP